MIVVDFIVKLVRGSHLVKFSLRCRLQIVPESFFVHGYVLIQFKLLLRDRNRLGDLAVSLAALLLLQSW